MMQMLTKLNLTPKLFCLHKLKLGDVIVRVEAKTGDLTFADEEDDNDLNENMNDDNHD